jgi:hypothetical protein
MMARIYLEHLDISCMALASMCSSAEIDKSSCMEFIWWM